MNPGKKTEKADKAVLYERLASLQRSARKEQIPVLILFEGMERAGKGVCVRELTLPFDPRGFHVAVFGKPDKEERRYPWFRRYMMEIPEKGSIHLFNDSWYTDDTRADKDGKVKPEVRKKWTEICRMERQLVMDGMIVFKFFLRVSREEHKRRLDFPDGKRTKRERSQRKHFKRWEKGYRQMIEATDTPWAPWIVVDADRLREAGMRVMEEVASGLEKGLLSVGKTPDLPMGTDRAEGGRLGKTDLSRSMDRQEYKRRYDALKDSLRTMQEKTYQKKIPVAIVFEGWDAAGKGGTIKRLTAPMDPRGYEVVPVSAPTEREKARHYLWRFWERMPKKGHIAVFDRSWYGRVLVERVEGFASPKEWARAYEEIREMEAMLEREGMILLKFWLHIDRDEQERRFKERMADPEKQWKLTPEDWRNREKWDDYEKAAEEMFRETGTKDAPWHVIPANSKYYARIKIMETILDTVEERLDT